MFQVFFFCKKSGKGLKNASPGGFNFVRGFGPLQADKPQTPLDTPG